MASRVEKVLPPGTKLLSCSLLPAQGPSWLRTLGPLCATLGPPACGTVSCGQGPTPSQVSQLPVGITLLELQLLLVAGEQSCREHQLPREAGGASGWVQAAWEQLYEGAKPPGTGGMGLV